MLLQRRFVPHRFCEVAGGESGAGVFLTMRWALREPDLSGSLKWERCNPVGDFCEISDGWGVEIRTSVKALEPKSSVKQPGNL